MISIGDRKLAFSASGVTLAFVVTALAYSTATFAQNSDKVKAGLAIWKTTGCADCHGPFADGDREDDDFPIGANLRTAKLDAASLRMTIRCGRRHRHALIRRGGLYHARVLRASSGHPAREFATDSAHIDARR